MPIVCQAHPTLNMLTKKSANLGAEITLLGTTSRAHQSAHSFQYCWQTFLQTLKTPLSLPDRLRKRTNTHLRDAKGLNAVMAGP